MALDIFVDVTLTQEQAALSREAFDTIGVLTDGATAAFAGRSKEYKPGEIVADFASTTNEFKMVENGIFAQNPRVKKVLVLREDAADVGNMTTLFNAIKDEAFFVFIPINRATAALDTLSTLVESDARKLMIIADADANIKDAADLTDIADLAKIALRDRTAVFYDETPAELLSGGVSSRILGLGDVGLATWHAVANIKNITVPVLTTTERNAITGSNASYFVKVTDNSNATVGGTVASGKFIDSIRGQSALKNEIEVALAELIVNTDKIPYTSQGLAMIEDTLRKSVALFEGTYLEAGASAFDIPDIADVSQTDKDNRVVNGIVVTVKETGAIHKINLNVGVQI